MLPHQLRRAAPWFLLDRLTDDDPENSRDSAVSSWQQAREFETALCRDLTALLNTRRPEEPFDAAFDQVLNSVLMYGIPDFTSYNLTNGVEQELVRRSIERAIRLFEPRLARVSVTLDQPDPLKPVLRYQIIHSSDGDGIRGQVSENSGPPSAGAGHMRRSACGAADRIVRAAGRPRSPQAG
jgi:type VI secretion system protein ImpF